MIERQLHEARILIVDDEPANVRFLECLLREAGYTRLTCTTDSRQVLSLVERSAPDVILLDLRMPHHDGFAVLAELQPRLRREYLPVLVLTADVTKQARERALSSGAKDFLAKPLDATEVLLRIRNLLETRLLHVVERVLLEQTLHGSVRALADVLALVSPAGFGRAMRARDLASELLAHLGVDSRWETEVAAMLSQIGVVTLAPDTVEKLYEGRPLSHAENAALTRIPQVASKVVANVPRLEGVVQILAYQDQRFDGKAGAPDGPKEHEIPLGARVLKLVLDLDALEARGLAEPAAMEVLRARKGWYDPELVESFAEMREIALHTQEIVEVEARSVRSGMVLAEDIRTVTGMLLVAKGQEVSDRTVERLQNSRRLLKPGQRVHVIVKKRRRATAAEGAERTSGSLGSVRPQPVR